MFRGVGVTLEGQRMIGNGRGKVLGDDSVLRLLMLLLEYLLKVLLKLRSLWYLVDGVFD
jgi:hypothetical protein